ncbi:hypothetical protein [Ferruginibacter sp.]|nr:hypothetical protein [Ferruginibacter sp.]
MDLATTYLQSVIKKVTYYKEPGDKIFGQLSTADFHFAPNKRVIPSL